MDEYVYTLKIWSSAPPEEGFEMPKISEHEFRCAEVRKVGYDEIEPTVRLTAPGIGWLTVLTLSPAPTDYARKNARKFARKLAADLGGVVENMQPAVGSAGTDDRFDWQCPKFAFPPVNQYTEYVYLGVWSEPGNGFDAAGVIDQFERFLPYALGVCGEPASGGGDKPAEGMPDASGMSREETAARIRENSRTFMHGALPGIHTVFANASAGRAAGEPGEPRVNCVSLELPAVYYEDPAWRFSLNGLLCGLCSVNAAFFGQIVRGQRQVPFWWWRGIPVELGSACVIGGAYYPLIPDCAAKGRSVGEGMAFFEEPCGPLISSELLSVRRRRLFGRGGSGIGDFTTARNVPVRADLPYGEQKALK